MPSSTTDEPSAEKNVGSPSPRPSPAVGYQASERPSVPVAAVAMAAMTSAPAVQSWRRWERSSRAWVRSRAASAARAWRRRRAARCPATSATTNITAKVPGMAGSSAARESVGAAKKKLKARTDSAEAARHHGPPGVASATPMTAST